MFSNWEASNVHNKNTNILRVIKVGYDNNTVQRNVIFVRCKFIMKKLKTMVTDDGICLDFWCRVYMVVVRRS